MTLRFRLGPVTQKPLRRARKWSGCTCKRASEDTTHTTALGLLKKEEEEEGEIAIFYFARRVRNIALYSDLIHSFDWKSAVEHDGGI